ncbi:MAG TPA: sigma-70 family RNA polymerase sigma factor [Streptosporangiaceae bacterium]|jgi:RNA polymerase sigma factor (sigma-70 family)
MRSSPADPPNPDSADDLSAQLEDRDVVWRALRVLPPRQRAVVVLRYYEDLSELEIAAVMGTSTGTVKSQSARALRRLAVVLAAVEAADHGITGARRD